MTKLPDSYVKLQCRSSGVTNSIVSLHFSHCLAFNLYKDGVHVAIVKRQTLVSKENLHSTVTITSVYKYLFGLIRVTDMIDFSFYQNHCSCL